MKCHQEFFLEDAGSKFEPKIPGLWNLTPIDSGTGSTVYRAFSPFGAKAVKLYNLPGSEGATLLTLKAYAKHVREISKWLGGLEDYLVTEVFEDGPNKAIFTWRVNPIQRIGQQRFNTTNILYSVSPWINGIPLSDILEEKIFPKELRMFNKTPLLSWLWNRLHAKRGQYLKDNFNNKLFIPIARNVLFVPGRRNFHQLVFADIRDYLDPNRNPVKNLQRSRMLW